MPMNLRLLSLAIFTIALSAFADVISPEQALSRVMGTQHQPMSANTSSTPKLVKTEIASGLPTVYVYSNDDSSFMILSADDQAEAMLAYGDNFNGVINPSMQWLLGEYSKEIESLRNNPQPRKLLQTNTTTKKAAITPLISTKWNQSDPFNRMCPEDANGRSVTGCVATAMAQIINHHKLPAGNGTGTASYQWNGQTLTFDFANNSFDWDNMIDVYDGNATQQQIDAVAELMYACGVSVQMGYSSSASGAYSENVSSALIEHFGFDKNAHMEYRRNFGIQQWNDCIYAELANNKPVYLSGANASAGHAFVCDGYSSDNFFHINWGWGGMSDGYFKLSALDPSAQGIGGSTSGYNSGLAAIVGIQAPVAGSDYFKEMSVFDKIIPTTEKVSLGSYTSISGGFFNTGNADLTCDIGFIIENTATGESVATPWGSTELHIGYGFQQLYFIIPSNLAEGNYKVYPAWGVYPEGTLTMKWTKMRCNNNYSDHFDMIVTGSQATLYSSENADIYVENEQPITPVFIGHKSSFNCDISNSSSRDFYGSIFAALLTKDGSTQIAFGEYMTIEVAAGSTASFTYSTNFSELEGMNLQSGEYTLLFADENGDVISDGILIEIQDAPTEQGTINVSSINMIGDKNNANKDNLEFDVTINCTDGYFIGEVNLWIFELLTDGYSSVNYIGSPTLYIDEGESITQNFRASMPSLIPGRQYFAVAFQGHSVQLTDPYFFTISQTSGIEDINTDQEVVAREYYTISGVKVAEEKLAPGIYIVVEKMSNGEIVTTKKMVR